MSTIAWFVSLIMAIPVRPPQPRIEPIKRQPIKWDHQPEPLAAYVPPKHREPEPVDEPPPAPRLDRVAEFKFALRTMTYGEFIEVAKGMGCNPDTAWAFATGTEAAQLRLAA